MQRAQSPAHGSIKVAQVHGQTLGTLTPRELLARVSPSGLRAGRSLDSLHPSLSPSIGVGASTAGEEQGLAPGKQESASCFPLRLCLGGTLWARNSLLGKQAQLLDSGCGQITLVPAGRLGAGGAPAGCGQTEEESPSPQPASKRPAAGGEGQRQ